MKTAALLILAALIAGCSPQMASLAPSFTSQGMSLLMQQEAASRQAAFQQQQMQTQLEMERLRQQQANGLSE
jgi:hypothetical protein